MSEKQERTKSSRYKQAYNQTHYESVLIQYPKERGYKARVKAIADKQGISVNAFIIRAIEKELEWYE